MVLRVLLGFFIGIGCEGFWEEGKGFMGFGFGGLRCVGDLGGFDSNATDLFRVFRVRLFSSLVKERVGLLIFRGLGLVKNKVGLLMFWGFGLLELC